MTFDTSLKFYDIAPGRREVGVVIAADADDGFCPLPPDFAVPPLSASRPLFEEVLNRLEEWNPPSASRPMVNCAGAAVKAGIDALSSLGGRVVLFQSILPQIGEARLVTREKVSLYGSEKEQEMVGCLRTAGSGQWYADLARTAVASGVAVDLRIMTSSFVDLATSGVIASATGGTVKIYPGFKPLPIPTGDLPSSTAPPTASAAALPGRPGPPGYPQAPGAPAPTTAPAMGGPTTPKVAVVSNLLRDTVINELVERVSLETGVETVLKIRTSPGLKVQKIYGNVAPRGEISEVDIAGVDAEQSIAVMLAHESDLRDGDDVFIQTALLYTSAAGLRKVRVHNIKLAATESIQVVFRHADVDSVLSFMVRKSIATAFTRPISYVPIDLVEHTIEMLFAYRKNCAATAAPGQLILPETLKLLPLYLSALMKVNAFMQNKEQNQRAVAGRNPFALVRVRADARVADLITLNALPPSRLVPYIYPRLYVLHTMGEMHGVIIDSDDEDAPPDREPSFYPPTFPASLTTEQLLRVTLPGTTYPSAPQLEGHGVYLLEHAAGLYLIIGQNADEEMVQAIFGAEYTDAKSLPVGVELPEMDNGFSLRVCTVIAAIRARRPPYLPLHIVVPADEVGRVEFAALLAEDTLDSSRSYVDLLCDIHGSIQKRLTV